MYLLPKSCGYRFYRIDDVKPYINPYMNILEKAVLTTSIPRIVKSAKSGVTIYNLEVLKNVRRNLESIMLYKPTQNVFIKMRKNKIC